MKKFVTLFIVFSLLLTGCFGKATEIECAKQLKSKDVETRVKAARKLGDVATAEAERLLLLHRDDPDFRVRREIEKSLKKIANRIFLN